MQRHTARWLLSLPGQFLASLTPLPGSLRKIPITTDLCVGLPLEPTWGDNMLPIFHTKRLREAVGGPPTAGMWQNHWRAWGLAHMSGPAVGHLPSVPGLVSVLPKVAPPATFSLIRAVAGFQSPCPQPVGWHLTRYGCWVSQVSCRWGSLHCTASLMSLAPIWTSGAFLAYCLLTKPESCFSQHFLFKFSSHYYYYLK